jgi:hypothetical protein
VGQSCAIPALLSNPNSRVALRNFLHIIFCTSTI